uniref:Putative til domain-containing cysteine-rich salivary secreted peptide n=1 Tax=Corethrella appendiculata TaxID=1370023 RepID=U5EE56_9DIPT
MLFEKLFFIIFCFYFCNFIPALRADDKACGSNEQYVKYGLICENTCDDKNVEDNCRNKLAVKIEACRCKNGYFRDMNGNCSGRMKCLVVKPWRKVKEFFG